MNVELRIERIELDGEVTPEALAEQLVGGLHELPENRRAAVAAAVAATVIARTKGGRP
jgi:hypothetical protein